MSAQIGNGQVKRKRVTGRLEWGPRGLNLMTDDGEIWVLERQEIASEMIGQIVVAEGTLVGLDRLQVDWLGEVNP